MGQKEPILGVAFTARKKAAKMTEMPNTPASRRPPSTGGRGKMWPKPIAVHAASGMLLPHFQHHSPSCARIQKPKFGIIYVLAFYPSLAALPVLLDTGRSLSIPFLAVMRPITHLLPGDSRGCQEEAGSSLSHAALSARSARQN